MAGRRNSRGTAAAPSAEQMSAVPAERIAGPTGYAPTADVGAALRDLPPELQATVQAIIRRMQIEHHPQSRLPYEKTEDTYRCIAFDGGPNTLTYLRCLLDIERKVPGFVDQTQLFAGTSDGAFAAAFMASQVKIGEAELNNCIEMVEVILSDAIAPNRLEGALKVVQNVGTSTGWFDADALGKKLDAPLRVISALGGVARLTSGLSTWADHDDIQRILAQFLDPGGKLKLGDLPRDIVIISYAVNVLPKEEADLGTRPIQRPKVYQNIDRRDPDCQELVIDVALRSAALPLFLPIHHRHIDGAVFANNPALCAIAAAVSKHSPTEGKPWYLKDMVVLSMGCDDSALGTERVDRELQDGVEHRWGWAKWGLYGAWSGLDDIFLIMDVVLNGDSSGVNYQAGQLLGRRFLRIAPPGRSRTVDKFVGVLLGRVEQLKAMACDTAATWAAEYDAVEAGTGESDDGEFRKILDYRRKIRGRRAVDGVVGWVSRSAKTVASASASISSPPQQKSHHRSPHASVPLYRTRSLREAVTWAKLFWMPDPTRAQQTTGDTPMP